MGQIYSYAQRVVVWLGPSAAQTKVAFETFNYVGINTDVDWAKSTVSLTRYDPVMDDEFEKCFDCCYSEVTKDGLRDVLNRPWFTRLWVLQEVCMGSQATIICGRETLDWKIFATAVTRISGQLKNVLRTHPERNSVSLLLEIQKLDQIYFMARQTQYSSRSVENLISRSQNLDCKDPRDRIYAQLAMFPDTLKDTLVPSYSKTTAEVYMETTLAISNYYMSLSLLEDCGERDEKNDLNLPSWVPNWSVPLNTYRLARDVFPHAAGEDLYYNLLFC